MARKKSNRRGKGNKTYTIVVDGETEEWYLHQLKSYERKDGVYQKTNKYYNGGNIYRKLKVYQETAIENASKLGEFDSENPKIAKAEMYKLFEVLKK